MTPEAKVKKKVKQILDKHGAYYFMPIGGPYAVQGVPDIICCIKGRFVGIECKANGNKPTALQEREITKIREAWGVALVIDETNVETLTTQLLEGMNE